MAAEHLVTCTRLDNLQVQARTKSHSWMSDAGPGYGGDGVAPTPLEMLLGCVGSCMIIVTSHYARQSHIALEKMWVDLEDEWRKEGEDERYCVRARIRLQGKLSPSDVERLLRAAERCPVRRILGKGAVIEIEVAAA